MSSQSIGLCLSILQVFMLVDGLGDWYITNQPLYAVEVEVELGNQIQLNRSQNILPG